MSDSVKHNGFDSVKFQNSDCCRLNVRTYELTLSEYCEHWDYLGLEGTNCPRFPNTYLDLFGHCFEYVEYWLTCVKVLPCSVGFSSLLNI